MELRGGSRLKEYESLTQSELSQSATERNRCAPALLCHRIHCPPYESSMCLAKTVSLCSKPSSCYDTIVLPAESPPDKSKYRDSAARCEGSKSDNRNTKLEQPAGQRMRKSQAQSRQRASTPATRHPSIAWTWSVPGYRYRTLWKTTPPASSRLRHAGHRILPYSLRAAQNKHGNAKRKQPDPAGLCQRRSSMRRQLNTGLLRTTVVSPCRGHGLPWTAMSQTSDESHADASTLYLPRVAHLQPSDAKHPLSGGP
jgi:hypothetical protein